MKQLILLCLYLCLFKLFFCDELRIPLIQNKNLEKRNGNVILNNFKNIYYYGNIIINDKIYKINFDTGSQLTWIPGNICGICNNNNLYNINNNKIYNSWYIIYADKSLVSGIIVKDTININNLILKNQTIGIAGFISDSFKNSNYDGIMGLGLTNKENSYNSIINNLYNQSIIGKKIFSIYLGDLMDKEIIFGNYDNSKFIGNLHNISINNNSTYWETSIEQISVNGKIINKNMNAIIDTGTTLIIFNKTDAKKIANNMNATEIEDRLFKIDCENNNINLGININGKNLNISNDNLLYNNNNNECILGFSYLENVDFIILGDIFIRNYYMIFDENIPQISIADIKR